MSLADEMASYQAQLEHVRIASESPAFDHADLDELREDLDKARERLEVAWLEEGQRKVWGGWLASER